MFKMFMLSLLFSIIAIESSAGDYDTYIFHKLPNKNEFRYVFDDTKSSKDLEYEFYKNKFKEKLASKNFKEDSANPDVIVEFLYGVLGESREVESQVSFGSFFGGTITNTMAKKYLYLYIYDKNTKQMIYQSKTISEEVDADDVFEVYDQMLKELFQAFPGKSGTKN